MKCGTIGGNEIVFLVMINKQVTIIKKKGMYLTNYN